MRCSRLLPLCVVYPIVLLLIGCGGGGSSPISTSTPTSNPTPMPSTAKGWTWESGSSRAGTQGIYGTLGVASANNKGICCEENHLGVTWLRKVQTGGGAGIPIFDLFLSSTPEQHL